MYPSVSTIWHFAPESHVLRTDSCLFCVFMLLFLLTHTGKTVCHALYYAAMLTHLYILSQCVNTVCTVEERFSPTCFTSVEL